MRPLTSGIRALCPMSSYCGKRKLLVVVYSPTVVAYSRHAFPMIHRQRLWHVPVPNLGFVVSSWAHCQIAQAEILQLGGRFVLRPRLELSHVSSPELVIDIKRSGSRGHRRCCAVSPSKITRISMADDFYHILLEPEPSDDPPL